MSTNNTFEISVGDNTYEVSIADKNINITRGDLAFTIHCSFNFANFYVIVFKIKDELIFSADFDPEYDDYQIFYKEHNITGFAKEPVEYINKILHIYPDIFEILGECEDSINNTLTFTTLTFTNLQKIVNDNTK